MLKQRIAAGVVLAPLFVWLPWSGEPLLLPAVVLLLAALAGWEWSKLGGLRSKALRAAYASLLVGLILLAWWLLRARGMHSSVLAFAIAGWVGALGWLGIYAAGGARRRCSPCVLGLGFAAVGGACYAFLALDLAVAFGAYWLTQTLVLVWGCDIGGYVFGRALGRHKLMPSVSPGKTWEGALGGIAVGVVAALIGHVLLAALEVAPDLGWYWLGWALVLGIAAIAGDLIESMLKRARGIKDSGRLIPGHGGVLDRIDALLIVAPPIALLAGGG